MPEKSDKTQIAIRGNIVPTGAELKALQKQLENDQNTIPFYKRKLAKQLFQAIFRQQQQEIEAVLEIEKEKLNTLKTLAKREMVKEEAILTLRIRQQLISAFAELGQDVEMDQLEFLSNFAEALKKFRQRLEKRDLDPSEKRKILDMSKRAFERFHDKLADLTVEIINRASNEEGTN